jgi:hypothetical protein
MADRTHPDSGAARPSILDTLPPMKHLFALALLFIVAACSGGDEPRAADMPDGGHKGEEVQTRKGLPVAVSLTADGSIISQRIMPDGTMSDPEVGLGTLQQALIGPIQPDNRHHTWCIAQSNGNYVSHGISTNGAFEENYAARRAIARMHGTYDPNTHPPQSPSELVPQFDLIPATILSDGHGYNRCQGWTGHHSTGPGYQVPVPKQLSAFYWGEALTDVVFSKPAQLNIWTFDGSKFVPNAQTIFTPEWGTLPAQPGAVRLAIIMPWERAHCNAGGCGIWKTAGSTVTMTINGELAALPFPAAAEPHCDDISPDGYCFMFAWHSALQRIFDEYASGVRTNPAVQQVNLPWLQLTTACHAMGWTFGLASHPEHISPNQGLGAFSCMSQWYHPEWLPSTAFNAAEKLQLTLAPVAHCDPSVSCVEM